MSLSRIESAWMRVERNAGAPRRVKHKPAKMQIIKRSTGESARIADVQKAARDNGIHWEK